MKKIKIGNKLVGEGEKTFIIAEAGVNHNGDFGIAKKMVKVAAEAGADAVTFQHIIGEKLNVKTEKLDLSADLWGKWLLSDSELKKLFEYAKKLNLLCSACVTEKENVEKIIKYGASFFKIVSGDLTYLPFLEYCATKKLPILLSTGAATLGEIETAITTLQSKGCRDILLYHTNSGYPTPPEEVNLKVMDTLENAFRLPIGFCDHTVEIITPIVAVAMGANVIEKHFTLNRKLKGPDYQVSLEPDELKEMIRSIRLVEKMFGSPIKNPLKYEEKTRKFARRSVVSKVNIKKGEVITEEMLTFKRPGTEIAPSFLNLVLGRRAKCDINADEIITWNMIF